mgnify:CR=1 FL=1
MFDKTEVNDSRRPLSRRGPTCCVQSGRTNVVRAALRGPPPRCGVDVSEVAGCGRGPSAPGGVGHMASNNMRAPDVKHNPERN